MGLIMQTSRPRKALDEQLKNEEEMEKYQQVVMISVPPAYGRTIAVVLIHLFQIMLPNWIDGVVGWI